MLKLVNSSLASNFNACVAWRDSGLFPVEESLTDT